MVYTIKLSEQQLELLKSIFVQIEPMQFVVPPSKKPKKLSKTQKSIQYLDDYLLNKALRKR